MGILDEGRLYFRTGAQTQADYLTRGMGAFTCMMKGREMTMNYHEVPPDILDNAAELADWARKAIALTRPKSRKKS